jgi:hypothetical protein
MKAPGERAWLYYDPVLGQVVESADYIRTSTGRTYLVDAVRVQAKGKHTGRVHLATTVMPDDHQVEADAVVHTLAWYQR